MLGATKNVTVYFYIKLCNLDLNENEINFWSGEQLMLEV